MTVNSYNELAIKYENYNFINYWHLVEKTYMMTIISKYQSIWSVTNVYIGNYLKKVL